MTIDHLIDRYSYNPTQRQIITNHIQRVLIDCEKSDAETKNNAWVEQLVALYKGLIGHCKVMGDDQAAIRLLNNTNVITLNYDRCFEYHFYKPIYEYICYGEFSDREFTRTFINQLKVFFTTWHPHGSIGSGDLPNIEGGTIQRVQCMSRVKGNNHQLNVGAGTAYGHFNSSAKLDVVGEIPLSENYTNINETIEDKANCIVMGLSKPGIEGCLLNWKVFKKLYYFGSDTFLFSTDYETIYRNTPNAPKADEQLVQWLAARS